MSGGPTVPEDTFRAEGHCCAITLPGIRDGETAVEFAADQAVKAYLADAWGIGEAQAEPPAEQADALSAPVAINPPK